MAPCTNICGQIRSLQPKVDGTLPTHDEVLEQLESHDRVPHRRDWPGNLGRWADIQERAECPVCQLVVEGIHSEQSMYGMPVENDWVGIMFIHTSSPPHAFFRVFFGYEERMRLAFVADNPDHAHTPDTARLLGDKIEHARIRMWLEACKESHPSCRVHSEPDISATRMIRVLDLELRQVVHITPDAKYVALSYVWGQLPMFKLKRDNVEFLSQTGSLDTIRKHLPRTINDAIDFVRALGLRYLWVDALCLVQDDSQDVHDGIQSMNSIYHRSYFTIVAGSGANADAGLPAVSQRFRHQAVREIRPGLRMAAQNSIDWHLRHSVYNTRGWTLQELVLPRRTVIFINNQVYFRCREANWAEELWSDKWISWLDPYDTNISRIPGINLAATSELLEVKPLWAYQKICEDYSKRRLRNDGDALRAVAGIMRQLSLPRNTGFVEGLPDSSLDMFLLFISSRGDLRRRSGFASFSWAGWEGQIMWPRENYGWFGDDGKSAYIWSSENITKWLERKCLLEWKVLAPSGDIKIINQRHIHHGVQKQDPLVALMKDFPEAFSAMRAKGSRCACGEGYTAGPHSRDALDSKPDYSGSDFGPSSAFGKPVISNPRMTSETKLTNPLTDYHMQLQLLEEQNRQAVARSRAQQRQNRKPDPVTDKLRYSESAGDDEWDSSCFGFRSTWEDMPEAERKRRRSMDPRTKRIREEAIDIPLVITLLSNLPVLT
ncbi:heterokaryon incompatibility protein-domain-containing protein [Apodospora peruviana]|uniref:Heterokaryon incompatibility protein-domain-containing protein n=1 Tax=Apodospora peruviana TaxID=516989 RepID=A0AAE0IPB8_9PEZI|nr:heterokaryon incompatibility protein-domain-containing protein [Apodospora peruviana]